MVTFLHTSDWQIGMTRRWLQPEAQARFDHDRVEAIRSLGRIAREQGCAFVVVAGDVFESNQLRRQTVARALEAIGEIDLPVYLLPGNHDPLDAVSLYEQEMFLSSCPDNVTVLDRTSTYAVTDGVEIVAAPWRGKYPGRDLVAEALNDAGAADGTVRIVVGHGMVDVLDPTGKKPDAIDTSVLMEAVEQGRIHYVALGDRHSLTDVGGHGVIWYSGTTEVTDPREEAPGQVLVVDLDAHAAPSVQPHRIGTWEFRNWERDVNSAADVARLVQELDNVTRKDRVVLQLGLRGAVTLGDFTTLQEVLEERRALFAGLHEWDRHTDLTVLPHGTDWSALGLSGFVSDAADEIRAHVSPQLSPRVRAHLAAATSAVADTAPAVPATNPMQPWAFDNSRSEDADSARNALALLYRLSGAGHR